MVENGWLDATRATTLKREAIKLNLAPEIVDTPGDSEYFVDYTKRELTERYGGARCSAVGCA